MCTYRVVEVPVETRFFSVITQQVESYCRTGETIPMVEVIDNVVVVDSLPIDHESVPVELRRNVFNGEVVYEPCLF